jgi:outer membrane protein assembly factor BamB
MSEEEEEADATEQLLTNSVLRQRIDPVGSWRAGVTRRGVLASLGGAVSLLGVSGTAVSETPAVSQQASGPRGREGSPRPVQADPRWRGGGHAEPASGHCPPETLEETWRSSALEDGVDLVLPWTGGSDERPVYAYGIDTLSPPLVGHVHALNPDTGEQLAGEWPVETDGIPIVTTAEGEPLFVGVAGAATTDASITTLDPKDGTEEWNRTLPSAQIVPGLLYDRNRELLLAVTDGPTVTGIDTSDGSEVWSEQFATDGRPLFYGQDGEILYIATDEFDARGRPKSATIWAVDTGQAVANRERWSESRDGNIVLAVPAVGDETVVAGFAEPSGDGFSNSTMVAIDASDGTERWSKSRSDDLVLGAFRIIDSVLYATAGRNTEDGASDGALLRIDPESGDVNWEYNVGALFVGLRADDDTAYVVTLAGDVIAVGDDPAGDDYGAQKWMRSLGGEVEDVGLLLGCDTLYTGPDSGGTVYALNTDDGTTLDTFTVASGILSQVARGRGSLWVSTKREPETPVPGTLAAENRVYRLDGGSSDPPEAPEASFTVDPAGPDVGQAVTFDAGGSTGDVETYEWEADDADGFPANGQQVTHTFGTAGSYDVTLTVTNVGGNTDATTETVVVSEPGEGPPALPEQDDPPQDLNGDGLYRDVDGDGEFSVGDVQLFFQYRNSDPVQNNPEAFNFDDSDPAEVTVADVQALFQDFQNGVSQSDADN